MLDRRRALDLHRDRVYGIDGGETVYDERNLATPRCDVLVFARPSKLLVAANQNIVSVELEADDVRIRLP
jgi:hypothetical protein